MRIAKTLMVRKPSNFEEVLKITKKYIEEAEEKMIELTDAAYRKLIDNPMTKVFDFLKNQGEMKNGKMLTVEIKCEDVKPPKIEPTESSYSEIQKRK